MSNMGYLYSLFSTEGRKLIHILNQDHSFSEHNFRKLKAAVAHKKAHIVDEYGNKKLKNRKLVALNDVISDGFNQKISCYNFIEPYWYLNPAVDNFHHFDRVRDLVDSYNLDIISEKEFLNSFMDLNPFIFGNKLTCKISFV